MKHYSRYRPARKVLIFWCLFIGIGAVSGAMGMFVRLDGSALGMQALLPYFQVLPFSEHLYQNFLFPGIALLLVNGIPNLIAAGLLFAKKPSGIVTGGLFGITLMLWICIQFVIFPINFMSAIYFVFGALQAATGYAAWVFYRQERFCADKSQVLREAKNHKKLVVYFSRMGYTKAAAISIANQTGAEIYEIVCKERTYGTAGFWRCGRYGMHRLEMPIERVKINWEQYDKITICSPVWVFSLAAPVRSFCKQACKKVKKADYVLVHFQRANYKNIAKQMDRLLNITHDCLYSVCCRKGKYKKAVKIEKSSVKKLSIQKNKAEN